MATGRQIALTLTALPLASGLLLATPAGATPTATPSATPTSSSSSAAVAGSTEFGLSLPPVTGETRTETVNRTEAQFGHLPIARVYADGIPASWTSDRTLAALGADTDVIYTFTVPSMAAAANGDYDTAFSTFLAGRPASVTAWVGLVQEPEGHVTRGEFTAADYRAATGHLAPLTKAAGAIPTTILTASSAWDKAGEGWRDYFSPQIDVLAWDAYNSAQKKPGLEYKAPNRFIDPITRIAADSGKAFGWAELGAPCIVSDPTCEQRAPWLTQMGNAMSNAGAQFVSYWNRPSMNGSADYSLDDQPSINAWSALMAR